MKIQRFAHFSEMPPALLQYLCYLTMPIGLMRDSLKRYRTLNDDRPHTVIVATDGEIVLGWCMTDRYDHFNVYVRPKYRRHGVGRRLAAAWLAQNGWARKKNVMLYTTGDAAGRLMQAVK